MEHLPVVLKKGQSFIALCSEGLQRTVCPRGKLLSYIDKHGYLQIHTLHGVDRSVSVDGIKFNRYKHGFVLIM